MYALCELVAEKAMIRRSSPNVFLVSGALDAETGQQADAFAVFFRDGVAGPFSRRPDLTLDGGTDPNDDLAFTAVTVIVGSDFKNWAKLRALIERICPDIDVDIVTFAPTGSADAMSHASLSQFAAELGIQAQAFGFAGEVRTSVHDLHEFGLGDLKRPRFSTSLGKFLDGLTPGNQGSVAMLVVSAHPSAKTIHEPMFTVLTRTQGTRMETLREVLLCLSAQTIGDFEHLIIAHNAKPDAVDHIRELIDDQSEWLRGRIRFEEVSGGTRTTPLNAGFGLAKGKYVVILDDDDIVFANWLEIFRAMAREKPGALLRAVAVRQEFTWAKVEGKRAARAVSAMHRDYAPRFDYFEHLEVSQTPPVSIAFPRYLFASHGMRFDETLTTTEDWDYIMRGAAYVGVASAEEITCIYRWWVDAENSRTVHSQSEWSENHYRIQDKIDACVNLMEAGSTRKFREVTGKMNEYLRWANKLHHDIAEIQTVTEASDIEQAKRKIAQLSESVQGEISTILRDNAVDAMTLVLPEKDMLPEPRLSSWQKLFAKANTIARLHAEMRRKTIEASAIFDSDWYLSTYPDVAEQKLDPLTHFLQHGSRELRSPSAQFNARSYYAANADLRDQKIEPVFHFLLHGKREGRRHEGHA